MRRGSSNREASISIWDGRAAAWYRTPAEFAAEIGGQKGCGKHAEWKSTNHFSNLLMNAAHPAGFALSHSHADDGSNPGPPN